MFLGHFAVAFGAKAAAPKTSVGTLILASQFVDLLWPTLLLLNIESVEIVPGITTVTPLDFVSYPISHSLLMVVVWGLVLGAISWLNGKNIKAASVIGLCVVSHWLLDLLVHRPDLPLAPEAPLKVGLGLWNSLPATLLLEFGFLAIGAAIYVRTTNSKGWIGTIGFWSLIAFLLAIYLLSVFGPPPPSVNAVAWMGQLQWLLVAWAFWMDRHREVVGSNPAGASLQTNHVGRR